MKKTKQQKEEDKMSLRELMDREGRESCVLTPFNIDDDQFGKCHLCKFYSKCSVISAIKDGDKKKAKKEIKVMQKKYPPSDFDVALHNLHQDMMNDFRVYPTNDLKIKQNKLMGEK